MDEFLSMKRVKVVKAQELSKAMENFLVNLVKAQLDPGRCPHMDLYFSLFFVFN